MAVSDTSVSDRHSPRLRVEEALSAMLKTSKPGDQLPPEPVLAKHLGVSRSTLREGLRMFAERGDLVRRHGVGTFVALPSPTLESGLEVLESVDSLARRMGLVTELADLEFVERPATPEEQRELLLPAGETAQVWAITRVITVMGRPVAHLLDVVPLVYLCREELSDAFQGSVLDLILQRGTPVLLNSRTEMMAESADAALAAHLKVQKGTALLKLVAQLYSCDERVVSYSISYFVPGYFKFHIVRRVSTH